MDFEKNEIDFDNYEMSLAHEMHRTYGPVLATFNTREINTLFELIRKFKSVGGAKVRRHAMHVVLDSLSPTLDQSEKETSGDNEATDRFTVESKTKRRKETKAKGKGIIKYSVSGYTGEH